MTAPRTYAEHARLLLKLGLPIAGANLAFIVIGLTDTVMLGWYSVEALAAQVIGWSVYFTVQIVGTGFAYAVMPMVAAHVENGEITEARRVTRMGLWASVAYGLALLPVLMSGGTIFRAIGQPQAVAPLAGAYLGIVGLSIFPALVMMVLRSHVAALERTQILLWANLGAATLNAVLDYALIFGRLGAPEMGVRGAAVATFAMYLAMLGVIALYLRRVAPELRLFARLWRIDAQALARVLRLGVPIGGTLLAEVALFMLGSVMMGWLGPVQLAAQGIALQLTSLAFTVQVALSNAATVRVGRAFGRGDTDDLRRASLVSVALSLAISAVGITIFLADPRALAALFIGPYETDRAEIVEAARILLLLAALFQTFDGLQVVGLGLLRGVQDTRVPLVLALVGYVGLGVPASYLLGFPMGLGGPGVWWGMVIGLVSVSLALLWRFRWQVRVTG